MPLYLAAVVLRRLCLEYATEREQRGTFTHASTRTDAAPHLDVVAEGFTRRPGVGALPQRVPLSPREQLMTQKFRPAE